MPIQFYLYSPHSQQKLSCDTCTCRVCQDHTAETSPHERALDANDKDKTWSRPGLQVGGRESERETKREDTGRERQRGQQRVRDMGRMSDYRFWKVTLLAQSDKQF